MDNIKDNGKTPEGDKNLQKDVKDNMPIDFFSTNESFVFVYKKTEKLATALYMVTNLFGDSEPMKWSLRSKVSSLLSFIVGFKDVPGIRVDEFSNDVKTQVLEIVSLLEIASQSGLVSNMNFSILKTEFMNMVAYLSDPTHSSFHRANIGRDFFNIGQPAQQGQSKPQSSLTVLERKSQVIAGNVPDESVADLSLGHRYSNRQNIILNLLKRKKEIVIQDVAKVIMDCSEKTIQRELMALVKEGLIKRTGERRWSKYTLIIDF